MKVQTIRTRDRGHTSRLSARTRRRVDRRAGFRIDANFAWSRVRPDHSIRRQPGCAGLLSLRVCHAWLRQPWSVDPWRLREWYFRPCCAIRWRPRIRWCVEWCCVGGNAGDHLSSRFRGRGPAARYPCRASSALSAPSESSTRWRLPARAARYVHPRCSCWRASP